MTRNHKCCMRSEKGGGLCEYMPPQIFSMHHHVIYWYEEFLLCHEAGRGLKITLVSPGIKW